MGACSYSFSNSVLPVGSGVKSLPQTLGLRRESSYFIALKLPETDNVLAE